MLIRSSVRIPAFILCLLAWIAAPLSHAADATTPSADAQAEALVLAEQGRCEYQIVLPDETTTQSLTASLQQVARMVQVAFHANGYELPIVTESAKAADKPAIYLGDTQYARDAGIHPAAIEDWGYHFLIRDNNVIIVGHDNPPVVTPDRNNPDSRGIFERLGTAKGVVDFLRQFAGVRFLYPLLSNEQPLSALHRVNLLETPAIEYLPTPRIALPDGFNRQVQPPITYMYAHRGNTDFYHLAMNRFPRVDQMFRAHTWGDAIPISEYGKEHPEYFALLGGQRLSDPGRKGNSQYCISNPQVQELMYQDLAKLADMGYTLVDLGQPDGFRACQCDDCAKLFNTSDWGEKIWILHRNLAQRMYESHPRVTVCIMSYIQTRNPPATFDTFPPNVRIMLTGVNKHETAAWQDVKVPRGFSGYAYFWTPNLTTRYTPMATPHDLERKMRDILAMNIKSLYLDTSGGLLFGLEGPAYYTMGRLLDDPQHESTLSLTNEFIQGAFGKKAGQAMRNFYADLYQSVEFYARYLSTREIAWTLDTGMGKRGKAITDPFKLIGFLYTPDLIQSMEKDLARAERVAESDKIKSRLALVRLEFEYLRHFARVTQLHQAYQVAPSNAMLSTLLDALDERNAMIQSLYDTKHPIPGWPKDTPQTFPPGGHRYSHLVPVHNGYQSPFANTFLNWDTQAMRAAMDQQTAVAAILHADGQVTLGSQQWQHVQPLELEMRNGDTAANQPATVQVLHGDTQVFIRITAARSADSAPSQANTQRIHLHLSPGSSSKASYRFTLTPGSDARAQAARGLISDAMDPRFGQYDPDWQAPWQLVTQPANDSQPWAALLSIPYASLNTQAPDDTTPWHANIVQTFSPTGEAGKPAYAIWSVQAGSQSLEDARDFGQWTFSDKVAMHAIRRWRLEYDVEKNVTPPAAWQALPDAQKLKLGPWVFQPDGLDQGVKNQWFNPQNHRPADWTPIAVPSFWAENPAIGSVLGYGWYHTSFSLPQDTRHAKSQPAMRLWFAAVDEQAWVYVNGQLVGEHTTQSTGKTYNALWEAPFVIDIPADLLKPTGNTLVVRVHNAAANGGIWREVYAGIVNP